VARACRKVIRLCRIADVRWHARQVAGTVFVGPESWSAASWLFDLVLTQVAEVVSSDRAASVLREIVGENLGALSLMDLVPEDRQAVLHALDAQFISQIDTYLPLDQAKRDEAVSHVADLVEMATRRARSE